jgi:ABC-type transporter Mla maintaining outer membrane lipid asymmetry ATPase subunit MlaF
VSEPEDLKTPDPRWHIRVRGLTKHFGDNFVLDALDYDAERGKVNVIIGT